MKVVQNMAELIGETPLVRLNRLTGEEDADVYVKLEYFNPSRSVKDRAAFNMIDAAEKAGKIRPGATIIEPTSGNTGIGLAMNAAAKGYRAILVMPDNSTKERINLLKAYGAEVVLTPSEEKMPAQFARRKNFTRKFRTALSRSNLKTRPTRISIARRPPGKSSVKRRRSAGTSKLLSPRRGPAERLPAPAKRLKRIFPGFTSMS